MSAGHYASSKIRGVAERSDRSARPETLWTMLQNQAGRSVTRFVGDVIAPPAWPELARVFVDRRWSPLASSVHGSAERACRLGLGYRRVGVRPARARASWWARC